MAQILNHNLTHINLTNFAKEIYRQINSNSHKVLFVLRSLYLAPFGLRLVFSERQWHAKSLTLQIGFEVLAHMSSSHCNNMNHVMLDPALSPISCNTLPSLIHFAVITSPSLTVSCFFQEVRSAHDKTSLSLSSRVCYTPPSLAAACYCHCYLVSIKISP